MPDYTQDFTNIPYGPLGIVALPGCEELHTGMAADITGAAGHKNFHAVHPF